MDSAKDNPVLLVHRSFQGEEAGAWARLNKALMTLGKVELREVTDLPYEELRLAAPSYAHVFLDLALADYAKLAEAPLANVTLVNREAFAWNNTRVRDLMGGALRRHSCFLLEDLSAADLVRGLHLLLGQKRLVGVTPLLEKGSFVVAEKVQSLDALGSLTDRLHQYFSELEDFTLRPRLFEFRLALSALLAEGFRRAGEGGQPYPTVDFQVGVAKNKAVINLRFPRGQLDIDGLARACLEGEDYSWNQAWARADYLQVTYHQQYDEVEAMLVMSRPAASAPGSFRTFLLKRSDRSGKRENLLTAPQNFEFRLLSQVRVNDAARSFGISLEESGGIDLGGLPPEVVKRLGKLEEESEFFREQVRKKDSAIKEAAASITAANKEISKKRNEILRLAKTKENQNSAFVRKIEGLEKRLEQANTAQASILASVKEAPAAAGAGPGEALAKLEAGLRAAENEKASLAEKLVREEKKVSSFEQKYSALYKDLGQKDKEVNELKSMLVKARKEQSAALASAAAGGAGAPGTDALTAKLKEAETKEAASRQELKKMAFKIENHDKNVKAIQAESIEKIKLLEQKLQAAKAKEVELLKKVEELSVALKKAAKAA